MTISIDKLQAVKTIISHQGCPDGIASAMILKHALPRAVVKFVQYGDPSHRDLPATEGMLFCDMTPPRERVAEFVSVGAIVLDHHKHAKDIVEAFGENGVFADEIKTPGVSGALLAFREGWYPMLGVGAQTIASIERGVLTDRVMDFATLAGIRDTWQRKDLRWDTACEQVMMLTFYPVEEWLDAVTATWPQSMIDERMKLGAILRKNRDERVDRAITEAYQFRTQKGTLVCVVSTTETSDIADNVDHDVVIGFRYSCVTGTEPQGTVPKMTLSMRSRRDYDVGALAKVLGGGGHTKAAGCSLKVQSDDWSPYRFIENLFRAYEDVGDGVAMCVTPG